MTYGNTVALSNSKGDIAPLEITESECVELNDKNETERKNVISTLTALLKAIGKLNKNEKKTLKKAGGTGMTFSSIKSNLPGATGIFCGSSSGHAYACIPNGLVSGGTKEQKMGIRKDIRESDLPEHDAAKKKAGVLCNGSYIHPGGGKGAHAEAKIINHLYGMPGSTMQGGSILLNIDWRFNRKSGPQQSGMPCETCFKMLCHAEKECKINIYICDKNNNPRPLSDGDCENDEDAYTNLCVRVDGNPIPGRLSK